MTVDAGLQASLEPHLDAMPAQLLDGVGAHVRADLRQDPVRRLDQHPPHVMRLQIG